MMRQRPLRIVAPLLVLLMADNAFAQQGGDGPALTLELNRTEQLETSCRLTFLAVNGFEADLDQAVLETVLFDRNGMVERLSLLDLQSLPQDSQRVRQFDFEGLACAQLGSVLINGVSACSTSDPTNAVTPAQCAQTLRLSSRVENVEIHK